MMYYIRNPQGQIVELELTPSKLRKLLKQGYKRLTVKERIEYIENLRNPKLPKGTIDVYYVSTNNYNDGFGTSRLAIAQALKKRGIYLNPYFNKQKIALVYHHPYALKQIDWEKRKHGMQLLLYTMFESTKLPLSWELELRVADRIIVPSYFVRGVMERQTGNIVPDVVPLGYDTRYFYPPRERRPREVFTFLHYDAFKFRKGWDVLFKAFTEEFSEDEPVRLILKTTYHSGTMPLGAYKNIKVIKDNYTQDELRELLWESDVFVFPSRGEGFGLTPLEALACGVPAIAPKAHGIATYFDNSCMFNVAGAFERLAYYEAKRYQKDNPIGLWFEPDADNLRMVMRYVYNLWKSGKLEKYSHNAVEHAKKFTVEKQADKLAEIIKDMVANPKLPPWKFALRVKK